MDCGPKSVFGKFQIRLPAMGRKKTTEDQPKAKQAPKAKAKAKTVPKSAPKAKAKVLTAAGAKDIKSAFLAGRTPVQVAAAKSSASSAKKMMEDD